MEHFGISQVEESVPPEIGPGYLLAGTYRIERLIAAGGSGTLYLATHYVLQRLCVLKVLRADIAKERKQLERFQREARTISKLRHPNIIQVSAFGLASGRPYIVMDHVNGISLADRLKQGPVPISEALTIFLQISSALSYAHDCGVIHRDLKPQNIMLTGDESTVTAKIIDFGLAHSTLTTSGNKRTITISGGASGTPYYMSPEQCTGRPTDERSDIYSMGCLMYEVISGNPPFEANSSYEVMQKQLQVNASPPVHPTEVVPDKLQQSIMKALAKDPSKRFRSMQEWIDCLNSNFPIAAADHASTNQVQRRSVRLAHAVLLLAVLCPMLVVASTCFHPDKQLIEPKSRSISDLRNLNVSAVTAADWIDAARGHPERTLAHQQSNERWQAAKKFGEQWMRKFPDRDPDSLVLIEYLDLLYEHRAYKEMLPFAEKLERILFAKKSFGAEYLCNSTQLVDIYIRLRLYDKAEAKIQEILRQPREIGSFYATRVLPLISLGHVLNAKGKLLEEEQILRKAKVFAEREDDSRNEAYIGRTQTRHHLATNLAEQQRFDEAIAERKEELQLIKESDLFSTEDRLRDRVVCTCALAKEYINANRLMEARASVNEARNLISCLTGDRISLQMLEKIISAYIELAIGEQGGIAAVMEVIDMLDKTPATRLSIANLSPWAAALKNKLKATGHTDLARRLSAAFAGVH